MGVIEYTLGKTTVLPAEYQKRNAAMQQRNVDETLPNIHTLSFGTFLKVLRDRHSIKQSEVLAKLPAIWTQPMYSDIERSRGNPSFDDLEALYQALHQAGVQFTLRDRHQFLQLVKEKLEAKRTHRVQKTPEAWDDLRRKLARIDRLPDTGDSSILTPSSLRRSLPSIHGARRAIDHLLGREIWLNSILETIKEGTLKVLVMQGPPGCGKTSEMHRLAHRFLQSIPRYYVVLSEPPPIDQERLESDIALELLLGDILEVIGSLYTSLPVANLQARIKYVLEALTRADRPVVIFLDNAEHVLDQQGDLTPIWRQFLTKFAQASHHALLVLATQEWPVTFLAETQLVLNTTVPLFSLQEGTLLLQRLGLQDIPEEQLGMVVEAVGGVPLCLEWVARLTQEPLLQDGWADFEEDGNSGAQVMRLLEDAVLFGGPVATKVQALLERVLQHLSEETRTALHDLALAPVPLGAPALKVLYGNPVPLKELREASLLVAYQKRVQLLPMVAAQVRRSLSPEQVCLAEERLVEALAHWLNRSHISVHEQGMVITELACLLLRRHRLLAASELVLYYGWLVSHVGQMLHLARRVQQILLARPWQETTETELETGCGARLLHDYLATYLGEEIDDHARAEADVRMLTSVFADQVTVSPLMQVYLLDHILRDYATAERFEEAHTLFETCCLRLKPLLASDRELHSTLLSKQAALYNRWSGSARSMGQLGEARRMQEQAISTYTSCLALLGQALHQAEEGTLRKSTLRKKQATFLNNLAYHLNLVGRYEDALKVVNACIELKEQGYAERDSLAASYGERSQILAALGQFQEALRWDERAREEIRQCAEAGDTLAQEEQWIYQVNQGRLYVLLGRVDEATHLLQEAEPKIQPRRKFYQTMAQDALLDIQQGRAQSAPASFQLDWRWVKRYRALSAYDAYWWWAHAGPFTAEEQERWDPLFISPVDEETKDQLRKLLFSSRDREVEVALAEHREPRLCYPAIEIDLVRQRIADFLALAKEIKQDEPNCIVRRLYQGAIEDEVCFLRMIEATYEGNGARFQELSFQLYPPPTPEEMQYALNRVRQVLSQGLRRQDTRQASQQAIEVLRETAGLTLAVPPEMEPIQSMRKRGSESPASEPRMVSAQAAKRFFTALLQESGYEGWQVVIDPGASGPRIESGLRQLFVPDTPFSLDDIREYVSHELLGHATRSIAGEHSLLGLLGMGTKGYMPTEEGIADYHERSVAALHGQPYDDSGTWLGPLAVGLASGVMGRPQTFTSLFAFFEPLLLVYRLLWRDDEDRPTAEQRARRNALIRCLRTYRGVPDVQKAGICLSKDVVYLRGYLQIQQAVAEDPAILDRLAVGKVALELLPDLQELGIVAQEQGASLRKRAYDPELDNYILTFEDSISSLPQDLS